MWNPWAVSEKAKVELWQDKWQGPNRRSVSKIEGERSGKEKGTHQEIKTNGDLVNRTTLSFLQPYNNDPPATKAELQENLALLEIEIATGQRVVKSKNKDRTMQSQIRDEG